MQEIFKDFIIPLFVVGVITIIFNFFKYKNYGKKTPITRAASTETVFDYGNSRLGSDHSICINRVNTQTDLMISQYTNREGRNKFE